MFTKICVKLSNFLTILYIYLLYIVRSIVCKQWRAPTKYRRYLFSHLRRGCISEHQIHTILFDQRKRRKDSKRNIKRLHNGFRGQFPSEGVACGKIVLNLRAHLMHTHKLDPPSETCNMCKSYSKTYVIHNGSLASLPIHDVNSSPTLHATPNLNYTSSSNLIEDNDTVENTVSD